MKRTGAPRTSSLLALGGLIAAIAMAIVLPSAPIDDPLTVLLTVCCFVSILAVTRWEHSVEVTGSVATLMLAVAFLGAGPAIVILVVSELAAWVVDRYRVTALLVNISGHALPCSIAAVLLLPVVAPGEWPDQEAVALAALAGAFAVALFVNWFMVTALMAILDGRSPREDLRPPVALVPTFALTVGFTVALAAAYEEFGIGATAFLLLVVFAFSYGAHLVTTSRNRTRQYASLSWGVLSGLVRTLDQRDPHAARHSAAVAAFSRDIAKHVGMGERDQELAHTAGLLHDIGRFAFADRVLEPGHELTDDDWQAVQRHPEIGADLLPDLEVYGPVAEIVRAHHERVDGRGYPDGLKGDAIPEIARIVAVAEAYDTLTAADTYREQKTSFEALTELRRVAGTQLDPRFVEALAELLAGRGTDYRHADTADFDRELAIQRKIADAVGQG
ncbi:MAG: HD domain-containing protein [Solirubrobacteraceae bacterium]|nr:HD domain-containing protein [Solirubrobacteraceae bacterium]